MDSTNLFHAVLLRAAELLGGTEPLARRLHVSAEGSLACRGGHRGYRHPALRHRRASRPESAAELNFDFLRTVLAAKVARGNSAVVCLRVMTAAPAASELADFLRRLISRYRDLHKGKPPDRVYAAPISCVLAATAHCGEDSPGRLQLRRRANRAEVRPIFAVRPKTLDRRVRCRARATWAVLTPHPTTSGCITRLLVAA